MDMDAATARKFKRNEFPVEARLDLHGKTEDEAFHAVQSFIKNSYSKGLRCILIITGKGEILQPQAPRWIRLSDDLAPLILDIVHPDKPGLGGQGVLYILLRRNREIVIAKT